MPVVSTVQAVYGRERWRGGQFISAKKLDVKGPFLSRAVCAAA